MPRSEFELEPHFPEKNARLEELAFYWRDNESRIKSRKKGKRKTKKMRYKEERRVW